MRLDIEGKHMTLAPHLMGWIAERLRISTRPMTTFVRRVSLLCNKGGVMLYALSSCSPGRASATRRGATSDAAADAAFR